MDTNLVNGNDLARMLPPMLNNAGVERVHLETLTKRPSFRGGDVSDAAQAITGAAREDHRRHQFGFWEFALQASISADQPTRAALVAGALRHDPGTTLRSELSLVEFARSLEAGEFARLPSRTIVCLVSQVETRKGEQLHIPMLDLGTPVSPAGEAACLDAVQALGLTGLLFDSGGSYHFYADQLVNERRFQSLLASAQLLSPIVDSRWISHQMIDGRAALRVSTDDERHPKPHRFVAAVE